MIYGVEQTTSREWPDTRIVRFRGARKARAWVAARPSGLAWAGAADTRLPVTQQNYHHRHRQAYVMPSGWTLRRQVNAEMKRLLAARSYRERTNDVAARVIWRDGTPLEPTTESPWRTGAARG